MFIERIDIVNFMPYHRAHRIDFPANRSASVFVFVGDNMRGKTSILNSIRWCLYGDAYGRQGRKINLKDLVNRDAAENGDWSAEVSLYFTHDGKHHVMRRGISKRSIIANPQEDDHFEVSSSFSIDGQSLSSDQADIILARIMSRHISRFYLFDGEQLQDYEVLLSKKSEKFEELKKEIEEVLGMPALTQGRMIFKYLLDDAGKQLDKQESGTAYQNKLRERLRIEREDHERLIDERRVLIEEAEKIKKEIEEYDEIVYANQDALKIKNEADKLKASVDAKRERVSELKAEYASYSPDLWRYIFGKNAKSALERAEIELAEVRENLSGANTEMALESLITEGIQSKECPVCHQDIPGDRLSEMSNRLPKIDDSSAGTAGVVSLEDVSVKRNRLRDLVATASRMRIPETVRSIDRLSLEIYETTDNIIEYEKQIGNIDAAAIARAYGKLTQRKELLGSLRAKIEAKEEDISAKEKETEETRRQVMAAGNVSPRIQKTYSVIRDLKSVFDQGVEVLRDRLKQEVQKNASAAFLELTTEPEYAALKINDNYGLDILDQQGRIVEERSAGAEQIVALSLMNGLGRTAGKEAPIIMDTPFGRLDKIHRRNIMKFLPKMSKQVILFVHEGELAVPTDLHALGSHLGRMYRIRRISSSRSEIKMEVGSDG